MVWDFDQLSECRHAVGQIAFHHKDPAVSSVDGELWFLDFAVVNFQLHVVV